MGAVRQVDGDTVAFLDADFDQGVGHAQHLFAHLPEGQLRAVDVERHFVGKDAGRDVDQLVNRNVGIADGCGDVKVVIFVPELLFHHVVSFNAL